MSKRSSCCLIKFLFFWILISFKYIGALRLKSYRLQLSTNAIHRFSPLYGLRSAVTSEDLKSSLQFKINGQWTATNVHQGLKLSDFLCSAAAELFSSPTSSKNAVRKGLVRLNGLKAQNTDTVSEGDVIESFVRSQQGTFCAELEKKVGEDPSAFERTLVQVLWEDDHCAVVIKPQGMPVFRMKESSSPSSLLSAGTDSDSLPCLQTALPYSLSPVSAELDLQPLRRPQAVHRLDKGTGGLILVAKTRPALVNLTAQFSERTVTKKYRAIVTGRLTDDAAHSAEEPIDSPNLRPREMVSGSISSPLSGQTALTDWSVQPGMHTKSALYGWISTVDLSPHTGRTHQLRRHMDLLRHPIMGDPDYWFQDGGRLSAFSTATRNITKNADDDLGDQYLSSSLSTFPPRLLGRGIFLWSVGISFNHPVSGLRMDMVINEPESYAKLRADLLG